MVAAFALAVLVAALIAFATYFHRLRGLWRAGLMSLRFLWVTGILLLALNPTCNRVESVKTKPLAIIFLDESASFRPHQSPLPSVFGDAWDTVYVPFGNDTTTSIDLALERAVRRMAGRPASAVWVQSDGVINQGISLSAALARLGNPPTFALIPRDSLPKNGWECVSLRFPEEVLKGENYQGTAVLRHRGTISAPKKWSLQWGSERIAEGVLPAAKGEQSEMVGFSWRPETTGVRFLTILGADEKKRVRVMEEPPTLVVLGKKMHPDVAYFVTQLTSRRNARVYYQNEAPTAQDFQAAIWLITGGQTVVGEEQFKGALVRLPSGDAVVPSSKWPIWPGESVSSWAGAGQNWYESPKPKITDWSSAPLRWEVSEMGYASASRRVDSASASVPTALVDRLWSSRQDPSFSIRLPDRILSKTPSQAVANWPGWTASLASKYPDVKMELTQGQKVQSVYFTPQDGQLEAALPAFQPGIVRYRARGSYGGSAQVTSGEFLVESLPTETAKPKDFKEIRSLVQKTKGAWTWVPESDALAQKMTDDPRFVPQMSEQKKSRQWRDLWGAFLLAALPLGAEAILRKRRTGRA
jgi:hypothetical protein